MHRLRRFAVALLGLLLVQLTLAGAGVACAVPTPDAAGSVAATEHDASGHAHHGTDLADAAGLASATHPDDAAPTRHHDGRLHCPSSMACASATIARAASMLPENALVAASEIAAPEDVAPASIVGAPEPPPPRG